jgi:hypothetical protein
VPYSATIYTAANDPDHWRVRANHARTIADTFVHKEAREQMLVVAAAYDGLAELAEKDRLQPVDEASNL